MLRLRPYKPCDADVLTRWLPDETALRKWSSDRYGPFPITAADINHKYLDCNGDCAEPDNFYPMTAWDETGVVGHLILRFPDAEKKTLRLGFVIVDPARRDQGYGKAMLRLAIRFGFEFLGAERITLGVFENNPAAYYCYRAVGFRDVPLAEPEYVAIGNEQWNCLELALDRVDA